MRGVKLLVTVMTTLIFICMGLLVYGLISKGKTERINNYLSPQAAPELVLPLGAKVDKMSSWREGLALHVTTPKGEYIYFLNSSGTLVNTLSIKRADTASPAQ